MLGAVSVLEGCLDPVAIVASHLGIFWCILVCIWCILVCISSVCLHQHAKTSIITCRCCITSEKRFGLRRKTRKYRNVFPPESSHAEPALVPPLFTSATGPVPGCHQCQNNLYTCSQVPCSPQPPKRRGSVLKNMESVTRSLPPWLPAADQNTLMMMMCRGQPLRRPRAM